MREQIARGASVEDTPNWNHFLWHLCDRAIESREGHARGDLPVGPLTSKRLGRWLRGNKLCGRLILRLWNNAVHASFDQAWCNDEYVLRFFCL